jgi:hypothetical protein
VFVCAKSAALVPVTAMPVIDKAAEPVLLSVTDWAVLLVPTVWLAKVRLPELSDTTGTPTPVPKRATAWGDPAALSAMVTDAPRLPAVPVLLSVTDCVALVVPTLWLAYVRL